MDRVRAELKDANLAYSVLGEALNDATTLQNCTLSGALNRITPHESLLGSTPENYSLCILGCSAYMPLEKQAPNSMLVDLAQ